MKGKNIEKIKLFLFSLIGIFFSKLIKRDPKKIAFGSWCGKSYCDNSKYLAEFATTKLKLQGYKIYWVGEPKLIEQLPNDITLIKINTFKSIFLLLRCKYMFFVQQHNGDICEYNVFRGAVLCFLDHGIGIKKWGLDDIDYHGELEYEKYGIMHKCVSKIIGSLQKYDYIVSTSEPAKINYTSGLAYRISPSTVFINSGYPRNSIFYNYSLELVEEIKEKYANAFGFNKNKKIILYLPTYRKKSKNVFSFLDLSENQKNIINSVLTKNNAILIEKSHFAASKEGDWHNLDNIIKIDCDIDLQELMLICNIQISDYSGSFLDFLVLDRPVINFIYDYEYYRDVDTGLYFSANDFAAGKTTFNFDETVQELQELLLGNDLFADRRKEIRQRFLEYESEDSMEIILNTVLSNKE